MTEVIRFPGSQGFFGINDVICLTSRAKEPKEKPVNHCNPHHSEAKATHRNG